MSHTWGFRGQRRGVTHIVGIRGARVVFFRGVCESAPARGGLVERRPTRHLHRTHVSPSECSGAVSMPRQLADRFHPSLSGQTALSDLASGYWGSAHQRHRRILSRSRMRRQVDCKNVGPQMAESVACTTSEFSTPVSDSAHSALSLTRK